MTLKRMAHAFGSIGYVIAPPSFGRVASEVIWVSSMGILEGILAKEEVRAILYSIIAMFLLSALDGTWFPLETSSGAFSSIGRLMPSAWAMNRIQNILIRGLGFSSVGLSALMLLAVWRFRKAEL